MQLIKIELFCLQLFLSLYPYVRLSIQLICSLYNFRYLHYLSFIQQ
uniref:Uncharacterized protein n=1 Tax=Pristionchus pacificus TaxID=54126 RepID=A0A2A6B2H6_PRIPA|eukprot:PDM60074.1 hypothetical protein PRIPAC_49360 [Pristionchus pacificus]